MSTISHLTTEFHFPPMDEQLEKTKDDVKDAINWRQAHHRDGSHTQVKFNFEIKKYNHLKKHFVNHNYLTVVYN